VNIVHLCLVPRIVHIVAEALMLSRVVKLLRVPLFHSRLRHGSCPRARCRWRTTCPVALVGRVGHLRALLLSFGWRLLESLRVARLIRQQPVLLLWRRLAVSRGVILRLNVLFRYLFWFGSHWQRDRRFTTLVMGQRARARQLNLVSLLIELLP
jgi:hypothetical protein